MGLAPLSALPHTARVVVRAPNHLGDGVMALPALAALAERFELVIHAPAWGGVLFRHLAGSLRSTESFSRGDAAVLFSPSFRAAWEARHVPRRVGLPSDWRGLWITDKVAAGVHTTDTYARLAGAFGIAVASAPVWHPQPVPTEAPKGHLALNPMSATLGTRAWGRWRELVEAFDGPVVFYGGPGEDEQLRAVAQGFPTQSALGLDALAAAWSQAGAVVSVDTGPAHFARAIDVPTVVLHGSTSARGTGPAGSVGVSGSAPCRPCYKARCRPTGCAPLACMDIDVGRVLRAISEVWRG